MDKNQEIVLRHMDSVKAGALCVLNMWFYRDDVIKNPGVAKWIAVHPNREYKLAEVQIRG